MIKRFPAIILIIFVSFGLVATASASDSTEARLSDDVFFIDDVRASFRVYEIDGHLYINILEAAVALNGTEKQFFPRWSARQSVLNITTGKSYSAIGFNLSRHAAPTAIATALNATLIVDGNETTVLAHRIAGDTFISLRDIARLLNLNMNWNPYDTAFTLNTRPQAPEQQPAEAAGSEADITAPAIDTSNAALRRIDPSKPMIALTFDDGPSTYTAPILDILESNNAVATFFVVGEHIEENQDIVLRTFNLGNEVSNHSWSHIDLTAVSESVVQAELVDTGNAIESIIGAVPPLFRPPFGRRDNTTLRVAEELGLSVILWSIDPRDWEHRDANTSVAYILYHVSDRDIILLHDLYESTVKATAIVVPALIERGFQLVTVSELLYFSDITPEPGIIYRHGR